MPARSRSTESSPSSSRANLSAWEGLTKALLHEAGGEAYVTSTGTVTSKGKELFRQTAQAWASYIALNPPKPNAELAQLMVTVYGEEGLNEPAQAVEVLQIAVAARPTDAALYAALAEYAYKAKNTRVGDLAAAKAVALAPAAQRVRVKQELAEVRKQPERRKDVHDHHERQNVRRQGQRERRTEGHRSQDRRDLDPHVDRDHVHRHQIARLRRARTAAGLG